MRLDPWTFWFALPPDDGFGDAVVVGITGAFLIEVNDAAGYLSVSGARASVDGTRLRRVLHARRAARKLKYWFRSKNVFVDVEPIVCLTHATAAGPRKIRGVNIVAREHLSTVIAAREQAIAPLHAKKAARALGVDPEGD